jgi:glycosyltransferase involved in cell wall biosynthesis
MMANALHQTDGLQCLISRWCFTKKESSFLRSIGISRKFLNRIEPSISPRKLKRLLLADLREKAGSLLNENYYSRVDNSFAMVDRFGASRVTRNTTAILAREDACLESFSSARESGIPRLYQLPTAHHEFIQTLLRQESAIFPDAMNVGELNHDFAPQRLARKRAELDLATHILCPSSFVQNTLLQAGISASRCTTIPLGADTEWTEPDITAREPIFLYVGAISVRKGIHRLLRIWKKLQAYKTHRLRLIGEMKLPESFSKEYAGLFEHVPRIPREELIPEYCRAQLFIFNALADGFGHVFAEAMICGTPVLASRNCGAPDLIQSGVEGLLYEYGNDEALAAHLDWALTRPAELKQMGLRARARALLWGWREFGSRFLDWVNSASGCSDLKAA